MLLDDALGFRFLIATTSLEAQTWLTPKSRELWRRLGGVRATVGPAQPTPARPGDEVRHLVEADTLFAQWMQQLGCEAVVVRPDRYVFGAASDPAQLNRLVEEVGRHVLPP